VDPNPHPGGVVTSAHVHTICGLYRPPKHDAYANCGLATTIPELLRSKGAASSPIQLNKVSILPVNPAAVSEVFTTLIHQHPSITFYPRSTVSSVTTENRKITSARLLTPLGTHSIQVSAVVDTTGCAQIATLAKHPTIEPDAQTQQNDAHIFSISGFPPETANSPNARLQLHAQIHLASRRGYLPNICRAAHIHPTNNPELLHITVDLPHDSESAQDKTFATAVEQLIHYLRDEIPGMKNLRCESIAPHRGIRESARWLTRSILRAADFDNPQSRTDNIALAAWPRELRTHHRAGPQFLFPNNPDNLPQIPLSCLIARDLDNLTCGGRCIGADSSAHASIRVLGTALATGQAAGFAACEHPFGNQQHLDSIATAYHHWLDTCPF